MHQKYFNRHFVLGDYSYQFIIITRYNDYVGTQNIQLNILNTHIIIINW